MNKTKNYLLFMICICSFTYVKAGDVEKKDSIIITKIWDKATHQAFTDLINFKNTFYCSFREGDNHVAAASSGKIRVLKSKDGNIWESAALLEISGLDLRDPKLSVTPDNRIMITLAGAIFESGIENGKTKVLVPMSSFSDKNGNNFSVPVNAILDNSIQSPRNWIWRVTWHEGVGYGINYSVKENAKDRSTLSKDAWVVYLMKTKDGINFENVAKLDVYDLPNESTIRFDKDGKMYVLIRREAKDRMGVLAESVSPYKSWTYKRLNYRLGGPNFIFLNNNKLLIGSRMYDPKTVTALHTTDLKGNIIKTLKLPSSGDNSYPGIVIVKNMLWVSYYSSHEDKTAIYLAKIPLRMVE